ncbi:MAG: hypothetical protein HY912_23590 [Desulfomonile tiedjei]|uniref:Uncharacterized protein n=1 Tax=Desulfomonile tiedjei TaxID=2358 RepID=A0A9D6V7R2_9BACT|nr:hypothetical protein [Desulfomonile tiedjei]
MNEKQTGSELWRRKFEPVTDWKPASESSGAYSGPRAMIEDALAGIGKSKDALTKALEPFSEEARTKIKDMVGVLDDVASKSSTEARSFLANILAVMAEKIKPK